MCERMTPPKIVPRALVSLGRRITLIAAKGRKDRVVALPCALVDELRQQMDYSRAVWQRDARAKSIKASENTI